MLLQKDKRLEEVHNLKVEIQDAKLERGEKADDVKAWREDIEAKLVKFEQSVNSVEKITKEIKHKEMEEEKKAELKFTAQMKENQFERVEIRKREVREEDTVREEARRKSKRNDVT